MFFFFYFIDLGFYSGGIGFYQKTSVFSIDS